MNGRRRRHVRLARTITALGAITGLLVYLTTSGHDAPIGAIGPSPSATASRHPQRRPPSSSRAPRFVVGSLALRLSTPLSRASVVVDGTSLLVIGGLTATGTRREVLRFDPARGTVRADGALIEASHDAAAVRIGSSAFLFGGGNERGTIATVQAIRAGGARIVGRLPQSRSDLVATTIGDTGYVLGGFDGAREISAVLATRDGVSFRRIATLPEPVRYPAVATVGTVIYVFGGERNGIQTRDIQMIDVTTGTARIVAAMPAPLSHEAAANFGGTIVLIGGRHGSRRIDEITRVNPRTGATHKIGRLPTVLSDAPVAVIGSTAYVVGGEQPARSNRIVTVERA